MPGPSVHLSDDEFVSIYEALNHLHVLDVGAIEEVYNIADKERYHAHQHVAEGIVQYCQCERNTPEDTQREIDERHDAEQRYGITPTGDDANKRIQIVAVHVTCQEPHGAIGLVGHQQPAPYFPFDFVHLLLF